MGPKSWSRPCGHVPFLHDPEDLDPRHAWRYEQVPRRVAFDCAREIGLDALGLLQVLAHHRCHSKYCDDKGLVILPSVRRFARNFGVSPRRLRRLIQELAAAGLVVVHQEPGVGRYAQPLVIRVPFNDDAADTLSDEAGRETVSDTVSAAPQRDHGDTTMASQRPHWEDDSSPLEGHGDAIVTSQRPHCPPQPVDFPAVTTPRNKDRRVTSGAVETATASAEESREEILENVAHDVAEGLPDEVSDDWTAAYTAMEYEASKLVGKLTNDDRARLTALAHQVAATNAA